MHQYLTDHVDANERFSDDRACQMLIFEAMRYHLAAEKRSAMQSIRTKPRKSTLGTLFCLGGLENTKSEALESHPPMWSLLIQIH
jgi:kelch-like protein 1/4/5